MKAASLSFISEFPTYAPKVDTFRAGNKFLPGLTMGVPQIVCSTCHTKARKPS